MATTPDIAPQLMDALIAHAAAADAVARLARPLRGCERSDDAALMEALDNVLADRLLALGVDAETLSRAMASLAIELCRPRRD